MSNDYPKKTVLRGEVKISENVIRTIAAAAAKEIDGVADLAEPKHTLLSALLPAPAVKVQVVNDMVEITVRIILESNSHLAVTAEQVQQNIKENVQSMTGVIVSKVHVIADGISFDE